MEQIRQTSRSLLVSWALFLTVERRVCIPLSTEEPFPLSSCAHLVFEKKGPEVSKLNVLTDQLKRRKDGNHVRSTQ
jgi:hypothetical protein